MTTLLQVEYAGVNQERYGRMAARTDATLQWSR
jgi:hypothetical protein